MQQQFNPYMQQNLWEDNFDYTNNSSSSTSLQKVKGTYTGDYQLQRLEDGSSVTTNDGTITFQFSQKDKKLSGTAIITNWDFDGDDNTKRGKIFGTVNYDNNDKIEYISGHVEFDLNDDDDPDIWWVFVEGEYSNGAIIFSNSHIIDNKADEDESKYFRTIVLTIEK